MSRLQKENHTYISLSIKRQMVIKISLLFSLIFSKEHNAVTEIQRKNSMWKRHFYSVAIYSFLLHRPMPL